MTIQSSARTAPAGHLHGERIDELIETLATDGFAVAEDFLPRPLVAGLIEAAAAREAAGGMARAAIGRSAARTFESEVRRVEAAWLDGRCSAEAEFLALAETLRLAINRRLYLGLFEFEAQFLTYAPGGFYRRHLDSLAGSRNRIVSMVSYLNRDWQPAHGGELDVWRRPDDHGAPAVTLAPRAGSMVLMLSEEIPHAARPAAAVRRVIAGWFRVNASGSARLDPAR